MVELRDVSLSYALKRKGEAAALRRVNARFEQGNFSAVIGPSGCGKTSLIKIMAGLLVPNEGGVFVNSSPLRGVRRQPAVIFQDYGLLPWKTVRANAELPLRIRGAAFGIDREGRQKVLSLLEEFGLASFANCYPQQLSGGMKQRLAIVRALAAEPELLLMDEPFSSLDALTREDAQDFLLSVQQTRRLTVIMVTHSIEEAVYLADSVYVMNGVNPGSITERITISRNGGVSHAGFRGDARFQEYCGALRRACLPFRKDPPKPANRDEAKQKKSTSALFWRLRPLPYSGREFPRWFRNLSCPIRQRLQRPLSALPGKANCGGIRGQAFPGFSGPLPSAAYPPSSLAWQPAARPGWTD
jgi:NitT/TauT family transport system ATP-binding protein